MVILWTSDFTFNMVSQSDLACDHADSNHRMHLAAIFTESQCWGMLCYDRSSFHYVVQVMRPGDDANLLLLLSTIHTNYQIVSYVSDICATGYTTLRSSMYACHTCTLRFNCELNQSQPPKTNTVTWEIYSAETMRLYGYFLWPNLNSILIPIHTIYTSQVNRMIMCYKYTAAQLPKLSLWFHVTYHCYQGQQSVWLVTNMTIFTHRQQRYRLCIYVTHLNVVNHIQDLTRFGYINNLWKADEVMIN